MSGEIVQMTPQMNMIFEPADLDQASPATVSRCGMIYMEPRQLGWKPFKDSYIDRVPKSFTEEQIELLKDLFDWLIQPCFDFIRLECKVFIKTSELHLFQNFLRIFVCLLRGESGTDDQVTQSSVWLQYAFVFSIVWGIGGTLVQDSKEKFNTFYRLLLTGNNKEYPKIKSFKLTKNQLFPEKGSVFDYVCDKRSNQWLFWLDLTERDFSKIPTTAKVKDLIIPTDETSRQIFFLKMYLNNLIPMLMLGPTGTG